VTDGYEAAVEAGADALEQFVERPDDPTLSNREAALIAARAVLDAALATGAIVPATENFIDRLAAFRKLAAAEALVADLREQLRKESGAVHAADDAIKIHREAREAAEARCADLEGSCDAWTDRALAAEAWCAELERERDSLQRWIEGLPSGYESATQARLAEAVERCRLVEEQLVNCVEHYGPGHLHCSACARSLTLALDTTRTFLAEGDT
jgi:hypothetical protein